MVKEALLERMGPGMGEHHGGEEKQESDEQKAHRLVLEELGKRRWTEKDLVKRRKTDAAKVKMAARLRGEKVMTFGLDCRTFANGVSAYRGQLFERVVIFYKSRD